LHLWSLIGNFCSWLDLNPKWPSRNTIRNPRNSRTKCKGWINPESMHTEWTWKKPCPFAEIVQPIRVWKRKIEICVCRKGAQRIWHL
jgi:hypothetical protein